MNGEGTDTVDTDAEDADFDSGFTNAPTATPEPVTLENDDPPAVAPTPEPEPAATAEPAPLPAPEYVQITKDQFDTLMRQAGEVDNLKALPQQVDKAFGKIGNVERFLKEFQAGGNVEVSDEDFAEMREQYPELAEFQMKGLKRVLSKIKGSGAAAPDAAAIEKIVSERLPELRQETINIALDAVLPAWDEEVKTDAFAKWLEQQPDDVKALELSPKPRDAARLLSKFAQFKATPPAQPASPAPPAVSRRAAAVAAAVTPRSSGAAAPAAPTEDDEFNAGFNYNNRR